MILFLDDEAELNLKATLGIHLAAGSLAASGERCRVIDLFCGLSDAQLAQFSQGAELIVVHSNGLRLEQLQVKLASLRAAAPSAQILLAGWLDGALAQIPLARWLAWVTAVYASGAREELAPFIKGIRQGALSLNGTRRLWGFDAQGVALPKVPCLTSGYAWKVRPLVWEKLVCDNICRKCTYASCLVDDYLKPSAIPVQKDHLRAAIAQIAASSATHVHLEDQTTPASFQKLWALGDLAAEYPQLKWLIRIDAARLLAQPELIPALGRIPLAGLMVLLPAMSPRARGDLDLPPTPADAELLQQIRQSVGDRTFVHVAGYLGYPSDRPEDFPALFDWAERLFEAGVLDHFTLGQAFIEKAAPIVWAGGYRFPFPGRRGAFNLPYWESDFSNSDRIHAEIQSFTARWSARSPLYSAFPGIDALATAVELGVGLDELRRALRMPHQAQEALGQQLQQAKQMFARRYLEAC